MEIKDRNKFLEFLKEKWQGRPCPMCQVGNWSVQEKIFELREFHGGGLQLVAGSPILPIIPITCDNCGNTILVNAIVSRVVEPGKESAKPEKEDNKK